MWPEKGESGFVIWRFRMRRMDDQGAPPWEVRSFIRRMPLPDGRRSPSVAHSCVRPLARVGRLRTGSRRRQRHLRLPRRTMAMRLSFQRDRDIEMKPWSAMSDLN